MKPGKGKRPPKSRFSGRLAGGLAAGVIIALLGALRIAGPKEASDRGALRRSHGQVPGLERRVLSQIPEPGIGSAAAVRSREPRPAPVTQLREWFQSPDSFRPMAPDAPLAAEDLREPREIRTLGFGVWAGLLATYLELDFRTPSTRAGSSSISLPGHSLGAEAEITGTSRVAFEFRNRPGRILTSGETVVDRAGFEWKSMGLEYQYAVAQEAGSGVFLVAGVQTHEVPVLSWPSENEPVGLRTAHLLNASAGIAWKSAPRAGFRREVRIRSQSLLRARTSGGGDFGLRAGLMVDVGVGISRHFQSGQFTGLYWTGQSLALETARDGEAASSARQAVLASGVEFRIGWMFR